MSPSRTPCQELARELERALIETGFVLSGDILDYCDSALGISSPHDLAAFLEQEPGSDLASLLELIFFPDPEIKLRLEPLLQKHACQAQDEEEILDLLLASPPEIQIYFPDSTKAIPVPLQRDPARAFIQRLRIHNTPSKDLLETTSRTFAGRKALKIQVLLRSARFPFTPANREFLKTFFAHFSPGFKRFYEYLRFAVSFLEELKGSGDIASGLVEKKIFLEQALDKADAQDRRLRSEPMEALLMQKEGILSFNREELRSSLQIVEDLCAVVLGSIPETQSEGASVSFSRLRDVDLNEWK